MTKQSITVMKQGFTMVKKTLVQSALSLFLATALMIFAGTDLQARTFDVQDQKIEMKLNQSTVIVTITNAIPGGSVAVDINTAFFASFPEAVFTADLDATGTQLAVILTNGPQTGNYTVGRVNVFDEGGNFVGTGLAKVKDGILEINDLNI